MMKKDTFSARIKTSLPIRTLTGRKQPGVGILEFVLVAAVLVVLGLLVLPNLGVFTGVDKKIADANREAVNIKTVAVAYEINHKGEFPADPDILLTAGNYIPIPRAYYTFDAGTGRILTATTDTPAHIPANPWSGLVWDSANDTWVKQ